MLFRGREPAFRLTRRIATFSLSSAQLEVGFLGSPKGEELKGISLVFPSQMPVRSWGPRGTGYYVFGEEEAARFVRFLDQVLDNRLPADFRFANDKSGRWFSGGNCRWRISKFVKNWHGGGGYRGRFDNSWGYTITKEEAEALRETVRTFFEVAA